VSFDAIRLEPTNFDECSQRGGLPMAMWTLESTGRCEDENPMKLLTSKNSAVGAGSDSCSQWPASGYRFGGGYPFNVWDVAVETRHGGIEVLGNKVNGFLKSTAPASVAEGPHAGGAGVGQSGYTTQLCRGVTESGARLPGAVSKGAVLDSPGAVPQAGSHKNPRPDGRYFECGHRMMAACRQSISRPDQSAKERLCSRKY